MIQSVEIGNNFKMHINPYSLIQRWPIPGKIFIRAMIHLSSVYPTTTSPTQSDGKIQKIFELNIARLNSSMFLEKVCNIPLVLLPDGSRGCRSQSKIVDWIGFMCCPFVALLNFLHNEISIIAFSVCLWIIFSFFLHNLCKHYGNLHSVNTEDVDMTR